MHELSLTQSLLNIVEDYAADYSKVKSLKLSFGRMSSIEPRALEFAFEVSSKGTKAEGACLELSILPVVIHCFICEKDLELDTYNVVCPCCGKEEVILVGGTEELKLLEMDVE
jgi:hydrogenase nickel incorporation protein HypA/HybF